MKVLKVLGKIVLIIVAILVVIWGGLKIYRTLTHDDNVVEATYVNGKLMATDGLTTITDANGHKSIVTCAYPEDYTGWKNGEDYNIDITVKDASEEIKAYEEELKARPSEIEGMTAYDKYVMGLDPDLEDTDGDGLSDADEIKLGTDGTRMSTAGDLYTDGYKKANGMDLFKKYEDYTLKQEFPRNYRKEVILSANKPEDFQALVETSSTDKDELTYEIGQPVLKAYKFETYSCDTSIDVTDILKEYSQFNLTAKDLVIYSAHSDRYMKNFGLTELDTDVEGNIIHIGNLNLSWNIDELDMEYDENDKESLTQYMIAATTQGVRYIFVCAKDNAEAGNGTKLANFETQEIHKSEIEGNDMVGLCYFCNFSTGLFGGKATVYYGDTGDEEKNQKIINDFTEELTWQSVDDADHIEFIKLPIEEVKSKISKYDTFFFALESETYEQVRDIGNHLMRSIFTYYTYDTIEAAYSENGVRTIEKKEKAEKEAAERDAKIFHFEDETFVFHNLSTPYADGVCAGLALIVAKTHNQKYVAPKGYYNNFNEMSDIRLPSEGIQWDITGEDNATFFDRNLSDYKDESFYKKVKDGYDSLTYDEKNFVNMATGYLTLLNDIDKEFSHNTANNLKKTQRPYMENINNVKKRLDKGEVLICAFYGEVLSRKTGEVVGSGHAVNIYRYEDYVDEKGKNCVKLFVYDSNFPGNDKLFIDIKPSEVKEDCFDYYYKGVNFPWSTDNLVLNFTVFSDNCYYVTAPVLEMQKIEKYDPETDSVYYVSTFEDGVNSTIVNGKIDKARRQKKFGILDPP